MGKFKISQRYVGGIALVLGFLALPHFRTATAEETAAPGLVATVQPAWLIPGEDKAVFRNTLSPLFLTVEKSTTGTLVFEAGPVEGPGKRIFSVPPAAITLNSASNAYRALAPYSVGAPSGAASKANSSDTENTVQGAAGAESRTSSRGEVLLSIDAEGDWINAMWYPEGREPQWTRWVRVAALGSSERYGLESPDDAPDAKADSSDGEGVR